MSTPDGYVTMKQALKQLAPDVLDMVIQSTLDTYKKMDGFREAAKKHGLAEMELVTCVMMKDVLHERIEKLEAEVDRIRESKRQRR